MWPSQDRPLTQQLTGEDLLRHLNLAHKSTLYRTISGLHSCRVLILTLSRLLKALTLGGKAAWRGTRQMRTYEARLWVRRVFSNSSGCWCSGQRVLADALACCSMTSGRLGSNKLLSNFDYSLGAGALWLSQVRVIITESNHLLHHYWPSDARLISRNQTLPMREAPDCGVPLQKHFCISQETCQKEPPHWRLLDCSVVLNTDTVTNIKKYRWLCLWPFKCSSWQHIKFNSID